MRPQAAPPCRRVRQSGVILIHDRGAGGFSTTRDADHSLLIASSQCGTQPNPFHHVVQRKRCGARARTGDAEGSHLPAWGTRGALTARRMAAGRRAGLVELEQVRCLILSFVVQPMAAVPQSLERVRHSDRITLSGRDVSGTPLTYAIRSRRGTASWRHGAQPHVHPAQNFTGQDRSRSRSATREQSRATDVTILVTPRCDTITPELVWTHPRTVRWSKTSSEPVSSNDTGPLYAPSVVAVLGDGPDKITDLGEGGYQHGPRGGGIVSERHDESGVLMLRAWRNGRTRHRDRRREDASATAGGGFRVELRVTSAAGGCRGLHGNSEVTIDELITGVGNALSGCARLQRHCVHGDPAPKRVRSMITTDQNFVPAESTAGASRSSSCDEAGHQPDHVEELSLP